MKYLLKKLCLFIILSSMACIVSAQDSQHIRLPAIFCDNMVLQQGKALPVWGEAKAGTILKIVLNGQYTIAKTGKDGKWLAYLPSMNAGGPFELKIIGLHTLILKNVMIGEVWFASGQSNMNFNIDRPDHPVNNSKKVIAEANYPNIREFKVPTSTTSTPTTFLTGGKWKVCTPENVKQFSAVAYFFARYLNLDRKVAVGIIHSSVNGTPIEAWISAGYLGAHPDFKDTVHHILQNKPDWPALNMASAKVDSTREAIVRKTHNGQDKGVNLIDFDDSGWRNFNYPLRAVKMEVPDYSLVWVRKEINFEGPLPKTDLILNTGTIAQGDLTYFNGVLVGYSNDEAQRNYVVPAKLFRKGKNVITVRFSNEWNNGRIGNVGEHPSLHTADSSINIPLEGNWRYNDKIEPYLPVARAIYVRAPTGLFNGMVSPVTPYAIKGVLWYQGEGNAGNANQYKTLFPMLLMDWRIQWKQGDLPFLFVQLPNYNSGWEAIREAQASLLSYGNTGMAVTIDVGEPNSLHPGNKEPVGYRLFLAAKKIAYQDSAVTFGPQLAGFKVDDSTVTLHFNNVGKGLVAKGATNALGFTIAGPDKKFYPARATIIDGTHIKLYCINVNSPVAIRYAWSGNPICNVYDSNGLPCAPFRTDSWE
jgi:sialate O-acetylesterase